MTVLCVPYSLDVASLGRESPEVAKLYKAIEACKTEVRLKEHFRTFT